MTASGAVYISCHCAEVAQSVEHSTENAGVPSSSLGLGTFPSGGSSNGRTTDFGSVNRGSNPCPPANDGPGFPAPVAMLETSPATFLAGKSMAAVVQR